MYKNTKWIDRVVDSETGELIQEGTDQSAAHFNNMEKGISDAHIAAALMNISMELMKEKVKPYFINFDTVDKMDPAVGDEVVKAFLEGRNIVVHGESIDGQLDMRNMFIVKEILLPKMSGACYINLKCGEGHIANLTLACTDFTIGALSL